MTDQWLELGPVPASAELTGSAQESGETPPGGRVDADKDPAAVVVEFDVSGADELRVGDVDQAMAEYVLFEEYFGVAPLEGPEIETRRRETQLVTAEVVDEAEWDEQITAVHCHDDSRDGRVMAWLKVETDDDVLDFAEPLTIMCNDGMARELREPQALNCRFVLSRWHRHLPVWASLSSPNVGHATDVRSCFGRKPNAIIEHCYTADQK
jgi:hypothetical protein